MTSCMRYLHVNNFISRDISTVNYYPKAIRVSAVFHPYIMARRGGGQNGVCEKLGGLRVMRECEARP